MNNNHRVVRDNYDQLSRWYDFISGSSERPARECGVQLLNVQAGERVLEIGCGTGEALSMLAAGAGRVIGMDLSAGMLRVAKGKLTRPNIASIEIIQGDGTQLPFRAETFDAIFLGFTLELFRVEEISTLLRECQRVMCCNRRLGVVSLLQGEQPGWMENAYMWAHHRWPVIIDCQPIPLTSVLEGAGFVIDAMMEQSMWGLRVGIALAH